MSGIPLYKRIMDNGEYEVFNNWANRLAFKQADSSSRRNTL